MKKMALLYLLVSFTALYVKSQPVRVQALAIGTVDQQLDDRFILPSAVKGNALHISYSFLMYTPLKKTGISAEWTRGLSASAEAETWMNRFSLRFSRAYSLFKSRNGFFNTYWGYSIRTNPSFIRATYKEGKGYSWNNNNDLCLYQSAVYSKGRDMITLDINLPLIGCASRPGEATPQNNTINGLLYNSYSDLFLTSWNNQHAFSASLDFKRRLNEKIAIGAGGKYQYVALKKGYNFREREIAVYAGMSWVFK